MPSYRALHRATGGVRGDRCVSMYTRMAHELYALLSRLHALHVLGSCASRSAR